MNSQNSETYEQVNIKVIKEKSPELNINGNEANENEEPTNNLAKELVFFFKKEEEGQKSENDIDAKSESSAEEQNMSRKELMQVMIRKNLKRKNVERYLEKQLIENEEIRQKELKKTRGKTYFLKNLTFSIIFKIAGVFWQAFISFLSCITYVVWTYYQDDTQQTPFEILELFFVVQFSIDYLLGFMMSKNKAKFFTNFLNMIDLITIVPVFALYIAPVDNTTPGSSDSLSKFIGIIKVIRVFRILRLYRIFKIDKNDSPISEVTEIRKKIIMICGTVLSMIFIAAGVIQAFQRLSIFEFKLSTPNNIDLSWDLSLYYMVVTCTTVGYGDISPDPGSWFARGFIGLFIMFMIILISKQTSELNTLIQFDSQYRAGYKSSAKHILLIGNITANNLMKFLLEFYHPDHDIKEIIKIFIVQENPPSKEIKSILENPKYEDVLGYMIGNIFKEGTLKLAKAGNTKVFIMNDQFVTDSKKDDTFALLASKALREFDPSLKIFVQLYDPDYLLHSWADWDVAMSTQSFKMGMIASNVFNPGFGTLISNLIVSSSCNSKDRSSIPFWTLEYMHGLGQEIYIIKFERDITKEYVNQSFVNVSKKIYREKGALLIGVRHFNAKESTHFDFFEVIINPHNYIIQQKDEGIILTSNAEEANAIFQTTPKRNLYTHELSASAKNAIGSLPINQINTESEGDLSKDHYRMWEVDMQNSLKNHIIIFGLYEHFSALVRYLCNYTTQYICYISDKPPGEMWSKLVREFPNVKYFECSLTNIEELARTGIKDAFHVILLTWLVTDSNIQDSGILPIARIMEENFKNIPFTLELIDEANMKYLNNRPTKILEKFPPFYWPRYAASSVFFSSVLDYIMAQSFHNDSIVEIVGKIILGQKYNPNISAIEEHSTLLTIKIPDSLPQFVSYSHVFEYFMDSEEPLLPIGLVRFPGSYDNELPFVVGNPKPNSPIISGDMFLVLGPEDRKGTTVRRPSEMNEEGEKKGQLTNLYNSSGVGNFTALDEIIEIANKMIKEDDQLNLNNEEIAKCVETELNITSNERKKIIDQNESLKGLLNEYYQLKNQLMLKKMNNS